MKKSFLLLSLLAAMSFAVSAANGDATPCLQPGRTTVYKTVDASGKVTFDVKTQAEGLKMLQAKRQTAEATAETYEVKVIVDPDGKGNDVPQGVWIMQDSYISFQSMRKAVNKFSVPAGKYLIQAIFTNNDDAGAVIFIPDIEVSGPTEVHLSASMADKKVSTALVLPSGEKAILPTAGSDSRPTDAPYNIKLLTADIHLTYDGLSKGSVQSAIGLGGEDYPELLSLRTNVDNAHGEVSFIANAEAADGSARYYYLASATMDKVDEYTILSNDHTFFHKIPTDNIARTPAYEKLGAGNDKCGVDFYAYNSTASFVGGVSNTFSRNTDLYICATPTDFSALHPMTRLYSIDYLDEDEYIYDGVSTPFFGFSESGDIMYIANQENNTYRNDAPTWERFPHNPALNFDDRSGIKFGDNFAVCVSAVQYEPWEEVPFSYIVADGYYGNYGERRDVDADLTTTSVKYNGVLQDYTPGKDLYDWAYAWATNGHKPGRMTYTISNNNFAIDGLPGSNICEVSYYENAGDSTPPTVQRIILKDASGDITNRFTDDNKGYLVVIGGDFVKNSETRNCGAYESSFKYYTYADASCEIEYAPYGSSSFEPLDVNIDENKFFMPAFGAYYHASLDKVRVKSENGWYDLRVTLTDGNGNSQIQTISPAFKIERSSSLDDISASDAGFEIVGGSIVDSCGSPAEVFSISGACILNQDLAPGIYIARAGAETAKIAIR